LQPNFLYQDPSGIDRQIGIESMPIAAALIDASCALIVENVAFSALTTEFRAGSSSLMDALHPDDRPLFLAALSSAFTGSIISNLEIRFGATQAYATCLAALSSQVTDEGGLQALVQLTDISALKATIADLEINASRWNNALRSSLSGVWDQRFDGQLYYSDVWRELRGMAPEDPIPTTTEQWLEMVHPQDRERTLHCIARQNAGDPDYTVFQYRERHKDGHYIWIECRGACVEWDENGQPARITGTDTDVTARKEQEEWLERISRRLKLALDVSRIGVFETDFASGTSDWDDSMRRIFEVKKGDDIRIGEFWESKLHPDDRARTLAHVEKHISKLQPFTDEYRIIADDGSVRYIRSNSLPYIDHDGHLKMIGVNWDVSEDHRLRQELERAKTLAEARNAELEQTRATAEYSALHDYLTGLPNRRYLETKLDEWQKSKTNTFGRLAVLHVDLDRFKQINDTLGHSAGDAMLKHAANILRTNIRASDFVARIGGDEFVLLVAFDGKTKTLSQLADRIIAELSQPVTHDGHQCRFGASIGISHSDGDIIDPQQMLLNADIALYNAKNLGRNRHEFYSQGSRKILANHRRLSDDLLHALENNEIVPFYQLQFDARSRAVVGAECLARWQHPEHGLLAPDRFLPIAEEMSVLAQIDGLILEKALVDFRQWRAMGLGIPKISVNVSAKRLNDPKLPQLLTDLDIEPGIVSFELLETVFLDSNDAVAMSNLAHLRHLGIDIEIDDFGTGHASIVGLLNLKPKTLKIDRQLIHKLPSSQEQRALAKSIIGIAKSLNIRVIAEGVETEDHVAILKRLGCHTLQGFGLAKPMDFIATTAFLAKGI
jgi:diguanylate cyclase (GGDEF)-like protein/PAS domain S-box-containing protein